MRKNKIIDITLLSGLILFIGILGIVISADTSGDIAKLKGATAECDCQTCANKIRRKDVCFYSPTVDPNCSTDDCKVVRHYWGQCPELKGGADCPLVEKSDSYWRKIEYKNGAPAACATASTTDVNGPPSTECGPHNEIVYQCVIPTNSCGGSVTSTLYNYPRSICDPNIFG